VKNIRRQLASAASKIATRLAAAEGGQPPRPGGSEFSAGAIHYEFAERNHAISCGGIGAIHQLVNQVGLVKALNLLGVGPRDLIAVLQAMKASGAIDADLEVM